MITPERINNIYSKFPCLIAHQLMPEHLVLSVNLLYSETPHTESRHALIPHTSYRYPVAIMLINCDIVD